MWATVRASAASLEFWTPEEDAVLAEQVAARGRKWDLIRRHHFAGRSCNSLRNRWVRLRQATARPGTQRCRLCGELRRGHACRQRSALAAYVEELPAADLLEAWSLAMCETTAAS